ncbi:MAG: response regulator transcription factor [Verrucomicrobiota bacterium]|nr:response regulator transcription factor [Limisphaera sp.]MDW8381609.1 response regulator transcription factor [Verrucomicrobiota bacterium]
MIRVFITDDHALVRHGLREILAETPDIQVVGEAATSDETIQQLEHADWDVLVLDLSLPGRSGLDVLRAVRKLRPHLPVLILSMHAEDQFALHLLRAGANGFLNKESASAELVQAIQAVARGETYLSPAFRGQLQNQPAPSTALHERLNDREFELLCRLAAGENLHDMAGRMRLRPTTIARYKTRLLRKTGMRSIAELIAYARQARLQP